MRAIEVWDLPIAGRLLQEWRDDPAFAARVADMVTLLRAAPPAGFDPAARALAATIGHVHLVGGAADVVMSAEISARGVPCTRSHDPFAAARAGLTLHADALCADVGQTALKLAHRDRAWRVERDLARAPLRDGVPVDERARARTSTLAFLASVLGPGAEPVVLALPCELDDAGIPRSCTYCWPDPDPHLVPDLESLTGRSIAIMNDAELAAVAAGLDPAVPRDRTTLVLTIGFGVGGALLQPRP